MTDEKKARYRQRLLDMIILADPRPRVAIAPVPPDLTPPPFKGQQRFEFARDGSCWTRDELAEIFDVHDGDTHADLVANPALSTTNLMGLVHETLTDDESMNIAEVMFSAVVGLIPPGDRPSDASRSYTKQDPVASHACRAWEQREEIRLGRRHRYDVAQLYQSCIAALTQAADDLTGHVRDRESHPGPAGYDAWREFDTLVRERLVRVLLGE